MPYWSLLCDHEFFLTRVIVDKFICDDEACLRGKYATDVKSHSGTGKSLVLHNFSLTSGGYCVTYMYGPKPLVCECSR